MSCIITYKGKKYSEEQFKEYFINNKQEFSTSIVKNKDVMDSFKRKMEGIDYVFSQSPELASIGSKAQYLQYLSTIFKTSQVKDIVYHGSPNIFDEFSDEFKGKNTGTNRPIGVYFTPNNKIADFLYQGTSEEKLDEQGFRYREKINSGKVYAVLLNFDYIKEGDNFIHEKDPIDEYDTEGLLEYDAYVAKNKEQIHILGSKQDIEGFKNFIGQSSLLLQKQGTESSKASAETLKKVKEFLKRIGVEFKSVQNIVINGQKIDANGVANLLQNLIEVVEGKEDTALTEEAMHFAVELIEQKNPRLFKQMLNKIGQYNIYISTLREYKDNKNYQKDGKPDVRKIKKEAVAKLLAEHIIFQEEGLTEKPELLSQSRTWWQQILNFLSSLFQKPGFNPFQQAAQDILSGKDIGQASDLNNSGIYFQLNNSSSKQQEIYDHVLNQIREYGVEKVVNPNAENEEDRNFYQRNIGGTLAKIVNRVTSVSKSKKKRKDDRTPTEKEKLQNQTKADWGTKGHADFENIAKACLNPDGTLKPIEDVDLSDYTSFLEQPLFDKLSTYLIGTKEKPGLLYLQPTGSKFIAEQILYNPNYRNGEDLAGTVDLMVITPEGKIKIFDWKFLGFDTKRFTDIPSYVQEEYDLQLEEYRKLLYQAYNIPLKDITAQFVPVNATYKYDENDIPTLTQVSIGNANFKDIDKEYQLPFTSTHSPTGNEQLDNFIKSLLLQLKRINEIKTSDETKPYKDKQIALISRAVRHLKSAQNFGPLIEQMLGFRDQIEKLKKEQESILAIPIESFDSFEEREEMLKQVGSYLAELKSVRESISSYLGIDELFLDIYKEDTLTEEDKKLHQRLVKAAKFFKTEDKALELLQETVGADIISRLSSVSSESLLKAEKRLSNEISKTVLNPSEQQTAAMAAATQILQQARQKADLKANSKIQEFKSLLSPFLQWAKTKGKDSLEALSLITKEKSRELFSMIDSKFFQEFKNAAQKSDVKWFKDNIDLEGYREEVARILEVVYKRVDNTTYVVDETLSPEEQEEEIKKLREKDKNNAKRSYDISNDKAHGWGHPLMKNHIKEEKWYTKEYQNLLKPENKAALDMYQFIRKYNQYAKKVGYLPHSKKNSFLPFVRALILDRKGAKGLKEALWDEQVKVLEEEDNQYGKLEVSPDTGELIRKKNIKYTTPFKNLQGEEDLSLVSNDLGYFFTKYIEAVENFAAKEEVEDVLLTLEVIEKSKNHLEADKNTGKIVLKETGEPLIIHGNEENAKLLSSYLDSALFEIGVTNDAILGLNNVTKKAENKIDKKAKISTAKTMDSLLSLFKMTALGFKVSVAIPQFIGTQLQGLINSNTFYRGSEFAKAEAKLLQAKISRKEYDVLIGLLDTLIPLNESVSQLRKNKLAASWWRKSSVSEIAMILYRSSDKLAQYGNAVAFLENTIIRDGELVNIREWLRKQPKYVNKYKNNNVKELEKEFEKEVKELQKENVFTKATFNKNGEIQIPGISFESSSFLNFRRMVVNHGRRMTAQMTQEDKANYTRNFFLRSFSTFKTWIAPQIMLRGGNLRYSTQADRYEYGRVRAMLDVMDGQFLKVNKHVSNIINVISGNEKGVAILQDLYERKKEEYEERTGKKFEMTEEEFYDMMRTLIQQEIKELKIFLGLLAVMFAVAAWAPDEDDDKQTKNLYYTTYRVIDKVLDEISFYYDPRSFASLTSGSFLPQIFILNTGLNLGKEVLQELSGQLLQDEELIKEGKPLKYSMKLVPALNALQSEWIPIIFPDWATEAGIKVNKESRRY